MLYIEEITGRQILDSRGNPTVEADVILSDETMGRAAVPSGASTGAYEAVELRDEEAAFLGKGVTKAVDNINTVINEALQDIEIFGQTDIDQTLLELDGTENKSNLGANAMLAVSLAAAKAAANAMNIPLWRYLGGVNAKVLPLPMMNIINGGSHADNNVDLQEFMIMPAGASTFSEALQMGAEIFHHLKKLLESRNFKTTVGDEGGFAPDLESNEQAVEIILKAVEKTGFTPGDEVLLALDPATAEVYDTEQEIYHFKWSDDSQKDLDAMIGFWESWVEKYPIVSIEDALYEDDWNGWQKLTARLGAKIQLVGDDLFVTNPKRLARGINEQVANSILIK